MRSFSSLGVSLRITALMVGTLSCVETLSMAVRWEPVPWHLPWRALGLHAALLPIALMFLLPLDLLAGWKKRKGKPGWLILLGGLLAAAGAGAFAPVPVLIGFHAIMAAAFLASRFPPAASVPNPWVVVIGTALASALAKGSLLERGGWHNVAIAFGWLAAVTAVSWLPPLRKPASWRLAGGIIGGAAAALPLLGLLLPDPMLPAASSGLAQNRPNILLIVLDTVRGDVIDGLFAQPPAMPHLLALRDKGYSLRVIDAPSPSSLSTHASLFTGLPAYAHGAHQPWSDDPDPPYYAYKLEASQVTIAERLGELGYRTAAISANFGPLSPSFGLSQGFEMYDASRNAAHRMVKKMLVMRAIPLRRLAESLPFPVLGYSAATPYRSAAVIVDQAIRALDRLSGQPFFLFLNIFDAHSPYLPPEYWQLRRSLPGSAWIHDGEPLPAYHNAVIKEGRALAPDEQAYLHAIFRKQLEYIDGELARLLAAINQQDTLIIIVSDHGESLGEHQLLKHSTSVYAQQIQVPILISTPDDQRFSGLSANDDPKDMLELHDLLLHWAGAVVPGRPRPPGIVSEVYSAEHPRGSGADRALFKGEVRSLSRYPHKLMWCSDSKHQLFDLSADPGELTDISSQQPERTRQLATELERYLSEFDRKSRGAAAPELDDEDKEAVRTLGYVQ